jgi:hypothetical protein
MYDRIEIGEYRRRKKLKRERAKRHAQKNELPPGVEKIADRSGQFFFRENVYGTQVSQGQNDYQS